jgi:hypothetical protein
MFTPPGHADLRVRRIASVSEGGELGTVPRLVDF